MSGYFNWSGAATLSLILVIVAGFFLYLQKRVLRGADFGLQGRAQRALIENRRVTIPLMLYSFAFLLIPFAIIVSVAIQSFATTWGLGMLPDGYTLDNYRSVATRSVRSIQNTLILGLGALTISIVISSITAYLVVRRNAQTLDFIATMPLAIPGVALGIAFIQTFNLPPFDYIGTAFLLVIAYAIRRLPHMLRTTSSAMLQVKKDVEEAAVSLGAPPLLMVISVVLPLVVPGILAGAIIVFVTTVKEISVTVLLAPAQWAPMSLEVFRLLLRGELYIASALAIIIVVLVTIFQLIAQRLAGNKSLF
jgi:iron(III) transport system permease protein